MRSLLDSFPFFPASTLVSPFCVLPRLPVVPLAFLLPPPRLPIAPLACLLPLLRLCRQTTHCIACGPPIGRPELQTVQRGKWSCSAPASAISSEVNSPICNFSMLSGLVLSELAESVPWLDECLSFRHVNMLPSVYNSRAKVSDRTKVVLGCQEQVRKAWANNADMHVDSGSNIHISLGMTLCNQMGEVYTLHKTCRLLSICDANGHMSDTGELRYSYRQYY